MRSISVLPVLTLLSFLAVPWYGPAQEAPSGSIAKPRTGMAVWDTGQPSDASLAPQTLAAKEGWTLVPAQRLLDSFKGDAVLTSGPILIVLRKQGSAAEVHSASADSQACRVRLHLLTTDGAPVERLDRVALVENTRAAACLEVTGKTAQGTAVTAKFRLKRGEPWLRAEPGPGAGRLRVECASRFVVLPDFFADDIMIDARTIPPATAELPSENFLLHLAGKGEALAMCVFENRQQDIKIHLDGTGDDRTVTSSEIGFENKKVWVALQEAPQVWHSHDIKLAAAGKTVKLDWKMPFPAQWRVDFTRTNGLTDSWEMLLANADGKEGGYLKPTWLGAGAERVDVTRRCWNTVLGSYFYPCWSDLQGQGYLQPLKSRALQMQGPLVIYPINRVDKTPLGTFTVVDVMRNTLGVGPCEYILDLENQRGEYRGRATCSVRDTLRGIYSRNQQKALRTDVNRTLDEGLAFVKHIRGRITRYVEFGHHLRDYLAKQKQTHPELADPLKELEKILDELDARVAARADKIQTPAYVAAMNEDFRKNVLGDTGPEALEKCKKYTAALVVIGDNQDELSGECRWVVKAVRQKAGLLVAVDPRMALIGAEIRARTQEALRHPANHEGPHH